MNPLRSSYTLNWVQASSDSSWAYIASLRHNPTFTGSTVDFHVSTGNRTAFGWLVESERKVDCRVEYEEDTIAEHCSFRNNSASVLRDPGYRPIEIAVSMTKMLHIRFLPSATGRWIFTKLELSRMLEAANAATLRVVIRDKLYGRLTRSEIQTEGGTIGSIYFSLVRA